MCYRRRSGVIVTRRPIALNLEMHASFGYKSAVENLRNSARLVARGRQAQKPKSSAVSGAVSLRQTDGEPEPVRPDGVHPH